MPNTFDWDNAEEIGIQLAEKYPGVDPLTVRFTDLHKWIVELPGFHRRSEIVERREARSDSDGLARGISRQPVIHLRLHAADPALSFDFHSHFMHRVLRTPPS